MIDYTDPRGTTLNNLHELKEYWRNIKIKKKTLINQSINYFFNLFSFRTLYEDELNCNAKSTESASEQYFHVVLFIMLYKVVLSFKSVDETLVCDH